MDGIDINNVAQDAMNIINEKFKNLKTLNIIVIGKTGVGKSTLINAVFRGKMAETGIGKPVTAHIRKLTKDGFPLAIYDTRGLELSEAVQQEVKNEITYTISKGLSSKNFNEAIHCIWYCISTASNRVEPAEIEMLRELSKENQTTKVPIIIVLTQSFSKKNAQSLRKVLVEENLDVVQVIPVLAEDYPIDDEYVAKSYGLDVLIHVMGQTLPDELRETFQNMQIASLDEKKSYARGIIATAVSGAAAAAAVPLPFADCAALIPAQVGMIAAITTVFGFDVNRSIILALLSATLGSGGATILGRAVVGNLIKLIPGVGKIGGIVISAATASALTCALGEVYLQLMERIFKGEMTIDDIATDKGKEEIKTLFMRELKKPKHT